MSATRRRKTENSEAPLTPTTVSSEAVASVPKISPGMDVSMAVVEILDVSLLKINAERRPGPLPSEFVPLIKRSSKEFFVEAPDQLRLRPTFTLLVHPPAHSPEAVEEDFIAKIDASFEIRYRVENVVGFGQLSLAAFARLNGLFNAWPYWRELVQSTATRLGLPALVVPPFQPMKAVKSAATPVPAKVLDDGQANH